MTARLTGHHSRVIFAAHLFCGQEGPWGRVNLEYWHPCGINFVAFGKSFDGFEAQLKGMVGAEDGITDALFKFTLPISGSYFWCPPMLEGKLDLLRALGL